MLSDKPMKIRLAFSGAMFLLLLGTLYLELWIGFWFASQIMSVALLFTALGGAYLWSFTLPHAGRINIPCDVCGRVNRVKSKHFVEGDTFQCRGCKKSLTFTLKPVQQMAETLALKIQYWLMAIISGIPFVEIQGFYFFIVRPFEWWLPELLTIYRILGLVWVAWSLSFYYLIFHRWRHL